ncbi:hypothetical protein [Micropruina sp.]|uniref:hypothetical protein n=1 Tax=Micropruina sp. TaxID=2737536 RepID=UPI0039E4DD9D
MPAASSVDRLRRALLLSGPLALAAPLLGACSAASGLTAAERAAALGDRLAARDRAGFLALFAADAGAQSLAERVFAHLGGTGAVFSAPQPDRLQVRWNLPAEPAVVSLAVLSASGGLVANLAPASTGTEWLDGPLLIDATDEVVLAAATAVGSTRWLTAARAGLDALRRVRPPALPLPAPLVVLVPGELTGFARYAGSGAEVTAAVSVVPGTADSAGVRVVVNPVAPTAPETDAATITHEAVHAGMRSPRLTGTPGWLLEGIAEELTAQAHVDVAASNATLAREAAERALPGTLPDTADGDPASYALAQVAVAAMVQQVGWTAVLAEAEARNAGAGTISDAQVLGWYHRALARLR